VYKGERTGRHALSKKLKGAELASWYFIPPREAPGFHNEEAEYVKQRKLNKRKKKEAEVEEAPKGGKGGKK